LNFIPRDLLGAISANIFSFHSLSFFQALAEKAQLIAFYQ